MKREGTTIEQMHIPARRNSTTAYVEALLGFVTRAVTRVVTRVVTRGRERTDRLWKFWRAVTLLIMSAST